MRIACSHTVSGLLAYGIEHEARALFRIEREPVAFTVFVKLRHANAQEQVWSRTFPADVSLAKAMDLTAGYVLEELGVPEEEMDSVIPLPPFPLSDSFPRFRYSADA